MKKVISTLAALMVAAVVFAQTNTQPSSPTPANPAMPATQTAPAAKPVNAKNQALKQDIKNDKADIKKDRAQMKDAKKDGNMAEAKDLHKDIQKDKADVAKDKKQLHHKAHHAHPNANAPAGK